jgi:DNA-binding beta-propeller fold protein YncE
LGHRQRLRHGYQIQSRRARPHGLRPQAGSFRRRHRTAQARQAAASARRWDSAANTYISDGYVNSRIAKVDKDGNWLKSWGEPGDQPGQFNVPHSIAVDAQNNIYVADRGNRRIEVFDTNGKFLRQFTIDVPAPADARPAIGNKPAGTTGTMSPGAPWTLCITPGPNQVLYTSDAFPGRIYKLSLDGKVLGVLGKSGKQLGQFGWIHEIACPSADELYVAELLNWRIQKLILEPTP